MKKKYEFPFNKHFPQKESRKTFPKPVLKVLTEEEIKKGRSKSYKY